MHLLALHACLAGQGIALGWSITSQLLLLSGLLVRPLADEVRTGQAFFLIASRFADGHGTERFRDWMLARTAELRRGGPAPAEGAQ